MNTFHPMPKYLMRRHIINKILDKSKCYNKNLIEIGYGSGEMFELYSEFGFIAYGYDFSEDAYEYASNHYIKNNKKITLLTNQNDIYSLKYDYVVACEVLEHIENDEGAIRNWKSILTDTGKLLISVPAHTNKWGNNDVYAGHYRRYEKKDIIDLMKKCGLKVELFYSYNFPSCLLLDTVLNIRIKKQLTDKRLNNEESSKKSGLIREKNTFIRFVSNKYFLYPIIKLQEPFYNLDLGSAYIILCSLD